jgi:hypothetical protein
MRLHTCMHARIDAPFVPLPSNHLPAPGAILCVQLCQLLDLALRAVEWIFDQVGVLMSKLLNLILAPILDVRGASCWRLAECTGACRSFRAIISPCAPA